MAAQTWTTIMNACIVACSQAGYPYTTVQTAAPDFYNTQFPLATSYAEGRICKDIQFLANRTQNTSLTTTAASRSLSLATIMAGSTPLIVPEGLALIGPAGTTTPALGTRWSFDVANLDVIDLIWPTEAVTLDPSLANDIGRFWAMLDNQTIVIAPTPPGAFTAEVTGLFQPNPISAANPSTYISTYYPELLIAGCMVYLSGALLRNFGQMAEDPKMALSWEADYMKLKDLAFGEEQRRRSQGVGFSQNAPTPLTAPAARN